MTVEPSLPFIYSLPVVIAKMAPQIILKRIPILTAIIHPKILVALPFSIRSLRVLLSKKEK